MDDRHPLILTLQYDIQVILFHITILFNACADITANIILTQAIQNQTVITVNDGCSWNCTIFTSPVKLKKKNENFQWIFTGKCEKIENNWKIHPVQNPQKTWMGIFLPRGFELTRTPADDGSLHSNETVSPSMTSSTRPTCGWLRFGTSWWWTITSATLVELPYGLVAVQ